MCRTVEKLFQSIMCLIQLLIRIVMTIFLMAENLLRMLLQTLYNMISFIVQMISLLPICCVFLITSRLKCFMCGGGGGCAVNRGGSCDCFMTLLAVIILFFIFRATGILDKVFYRLGYAKTDVTRYPTGTITECTRNETEYPWYDYGHDDDDKGAHDNDLRLRKTNELETEEQYFGNTVINDDGKLKLVKINQLETEEQNLEANEQTDKEQPTLIIITLLSPTTTTSEPPLIESTDVVISTVEPKASPTTTLPPVTLTQPVISTQLVTSTQLIQTRKKGLTLVEYLEIYSTTMRDQTIALSPNGWGSESSQTEWTTVLYYLVA